MIDRSSLIPYYIQIKEHLLKGINDNTYPVGSKIPSESELTKMFGVSRITVRQAIEALAQEGRVEKTQGKGTFVRRPKVMQELNVITSWTETMRIRGMHPETRAFSCLEQPAQEALAQVLEIDPLDPVYAIERLNYANEEPVCIMKNYLPVKLVPDLITHRINHGLYEILEGKYGLVLASAVETIEARAANSKEAEALRIRRGSPILNVQRVTYDPDGRPIEYVIVSSIADKYAYTVSLHGRPKRT